ncbi:Zinc finger, CCHC domain-containing protein [Mortierella sp. 14UC]|nr:Zinc finger, CCHC domain-containing protein [Mortierella sp. 14UC]
MAHLAGAFQQVREMFEDDRSGRLLIPSDNFIRASRLDEPKYLGYYIKGLKGGSFFIYPYTHKRPYRSSVYDGQMEPYNDRKCTYGDDYVALAGFRPSDTKVFLDNYAKEVPERFQNDIAHLLQGLRDSYWRCRGSGGTKCAVEHNSRKRRKIEEKQAEETARQEESARLEQEHRRKEQDEAKRVAERLELVQARRRYEDNVQEAHYAKRASAAERSRINNPVFQYIDKPHASLSASRAREDQVESLRMRLEKRLRTRFNDKIAVDILDPLPLDSSDADMTVLNMPSNVYIDELANVLHDLKFLDVTYLPKAKVPVATFFDPTANIHCDVTIGNRIVVTNSQLVKIYRRVDYRFKTLWFVIRQLTLKHNILNSSTGHLSSYTLTLMLIVYLQYVTEPPILPKLQRVFISGVEYLHIDGHDCSFDKHDAGYHNFGIGCKNTKSAGELLLDFLEYYDKTFNYDTQEVNPLYGTIVLRCVDPLFLPPSAKSTRSEYSFVVRDPFIAGRNVAGNCRASQIKDIKKCFRDSFDALSRGDIDTAFRR